MSAQPIGQLETRCRERPDDPEAFLVLARAYEQAGNPGKAFLVYSQAIAKDWGEQAWLDFHKRFYADALAEREKIFLQITDQARSDPKPDARAYLACAYAQTGQLEKAVNELERAASDSRAGEPMPDFLREAYRAVAAGLLLQGLEDRHEWVRRHAAQALAEVGDKSGIPVLVKALKESSWVARESAALALAELGHTAGFTALVDGLKESDSEIRKEAAKALLKVGNQSIVPELSSALEDHDPNVRIEAIVTLTRWATPRLCPDSGRR
jgi:tetratricopeptide (TPR) repeat protein